MARPKKCCWYALLALLNIAVVSAPAAAQGIPDVTPIPTVTGPIPVTADSYPLMAADKVQVVIDLPKLGYVEEEFFVSGRANVYDWAADGTLTVRTPAARYTTRILLRRPADPRRFSGNVIVELPNMARRYDWVMTWSLQHAHFIERRVGGSDVCARGYRSAQGIQSRPVRAALDGESDAESGMSG